jgi:hypothetical protein
MFSEADGVPTRNYADLPAPRRVAGDLSNKGSAPRQFNVDRPPTNIPESDGPAPMPAPHPPMQSVRQAPPAPSDWSAFEWVPMSLDETRGFVTNLEQAHANGMPAEAVVDVFCNSFPMELISQIPKLIPVDKFIESVRTSPATKSFSLATGRGRRYLTDVWKVLNGRIDAWMEEQTAPQPAAAAEPTRQPVKEGES